MFFLQFFEFNLENKKMVSWYGKSPDFLM